MGGPPNHRVQRTANMLMTNVSQVDHLFLPNHYRNAPPLTRDVRQEALLGQKMLQALIRNKLAIPLIENCLTATVFGRLLYLPETILWDAMRSAVVSNCSLPDRCGELERENVEFWPQWQLKLPNAPPQRKEPDVAMPFSEFTVIVEAKRWDSDQQSCAQLAEEWLAYHQRNDAKSDAYILAVGGLSSVSKERCAELEQNINNFVSTHAGTGYEGVPHPRVLIASWEGIAQSLWRVSKRTDLAPETARILADTIAGLRLFGHSHRPPLWLLDVWHIVQRSAGIRDHLPTRSYDDEFSSWKIICDYWKKGFGAV